MNKTKEQLAEDHAASLYPDKYQDAPYTTRGDLFVLAEDSFKKGFEAAEPKWIPISEHKAGHILRYHKLWKCIISVRLIKEVDPVYSNVSTCIWVDSTNGNTWQEESFEPYFMMPLPSPPKQ